MNSKFLAGLVASLIALVVVVGLALFLALVIEIEPTKNWFTTTAALLTVAVWGIMYRLFKPPPDATTTLDGELIEEVIKELDDSEFKKAYLKHNTKTRTIGGILSLICLPGAIAIAIFGGELDGTMIGGISLLAFFGLLGGLVWFKAQKMVAGVKNGTDPLMNAIANNSTNYVVWFHGVIMEQPSPTKTIKTYSVHIYNSKGVKPVMLGTKNEESYKEILAFLDAKFPNAESKTSASIRASMKEKYNFKGAK